MRSSTEEILHWVSKFRVLSDWTVTFDDEVEYKGQCCVNVETKRATIYGWGPHEAMETDYFAHEVLHVAFRAAGAKGREGEEMFVQDLCEILFHEQVRND